MTILQNVYIYTYIGVSVCVYNLEIATKEDTMAIMKKMLGATGT